MPSPRGALGRDFVAVNATQFTLTASREAEYQREVRRHRKVARSHAYAGSDLAAPRRRTANGYPVEVRNGLPAPMRREITDTARCGCVRRLVLSVMDWELVSRCGADHA